MWRMMQAAVYVMVLSFGLFELGGFALYKGEVLREIYSEQAGPETTVVSYYKAKLLLAEPAIYEPEQMETNKPAAIEKDLPNNRVEAKLTAKSEKIIYLTFDDGPSKNTEQVLQILKQEEVKATFFVLGEQVLKQPEMTKRIIEEGHSIGNHTFNHKYESLYGDFAEFADQVMKTDEAIYRTTGVRTTLFRAPGGTYRNFDQGYFDAMAAAGYQVHDWNVDSGDSRRVGVPAAEIIKTIKGSTLVNKLNVLLHDGSGHSESVKALPAIIKYYKSKGYTFALLTDQIEPIQFGVAKQLKWTRPKVTEKQATNLAKFSEEFSNSVKRAQAEKQAPSLILHRGNHELVLKPDEYRLIKGAIEISKRKLTEWIRSGAELKAEKDMLPLRLSLQKLGITITNYVYNDQQREVWISD